MKDAKQQADAVVKEYMDAVDDGNYALAGRVIDANPDLVDAIAKALLQPYYEE